MKKYYNIQSISHGFKLIGDNNEVLIMGKSKYDNKNIPYYLKQISPEPKYLSGLFYNKRYDIYKGKDTQNKNFKLRLGVQYAILEYWVLR